MLSHITWILSGEVHRETKVFLLNKGCVEYVLFFKPSWHETGQMNV